MQSDYAKQGKTAAIIAYITIVGTIIAYFMNQDNKNKFANFHIRQALGINISFYVLGVFVSIFDSWAISSAFYIFIFVLFGYGLITASREEQKTVPILGPYFQEWFNFIK
ncbi:membrane protein [Aquimarina pacifica]|uniref:membrane protein n=1 Tax=Aquimarina pacifica TaxID=1296415 RepID=UPI000470188E|nr:membrane protein [Aquimarina pacifica]